MRTFIGNILILKIQPSFAADFISVIPAWLRLRVALFAYKN